MKKFEETMNEWIKVNKQLYKDCVEYLKDALKKNGGSVEIDSDNAFVTITYDGGSHPEYASNAFSQVLRVYDKDDGMYLETEDADEYPISYVEASELYDICHYVETYVIGGKDGE